MSSNYSVLVRRELSESFLGDVMVTMVESGMTCLWYWGSATSVGRKDDLTVTGFRVTENMEHEDGGEPSSKWIGYAEVAGAIQAMLDRKLVGSEVMSYIYRAVLEDDAGDIDATAADCILQVALFGEVVYG